MVKTHNGQTGIKLLFKTNEKYRYGLQKTQSKHLKMLLMAKLKEFSCARVLLIVLSSTFLFFQVCIDTCTLLFKYLWFSQTDRIGSQVAQAHYESPEDNIIVLSQLIIHTARKL